MEKVIRKLNEYYVGKGVIYLQNITGPGGWTVRGRLRISEVRLEEKPHLIHNPYTVFYLHSLYVEGKCPELSSHKHYSQVPISSSLTHYFLSDFMLRIYTYYNVSQAYAKYKVYNWRSHKGSVYNDRK